MNKIINTNAENIYYNKLATKLLLDKLECNYIALSSELFSRDGQPVHYGFEVYEYVGYTIGEMIQKPKGWQFNCQRLLADLQMKQSKILYQNADPLNVIMANAGKIIKNKKYDEYGSTIGLLHDNVNASINGKIEKIISDLYSDEGYSGKDSTKALYWIRQALDKGGNYFNSLYTILAKRGKYEDYLELFTKALKYSEYNDGVALGCLGRMYRDGKIVERDYEKAAEYMRRSFDAKVPWAKNELYDIYWRANTPESLGKLIEQCTKLAEAGDGISLAWLGRAYRDGRGVEKNIEKAMGYYKDAILKGITWAKTELDLLNKQVGN